jgi:hypothetical protein
MIYRESSVYDSYKGKEFDTFNSQKGYGDAWEIPYFCVLMEEVGPCTP